MFLKLNRGLILPVLLPSCIANKFKFQNGGNIKIETMVKTEVMFGYCPSPT